MISIIIPAYNEFQNLQRLLPRLSRLLPPYPDTEVLVALSPANTDSSHELDLPAGGRFIKCRAKGRALQMNEAVENSKGDILVFLHADVLPPEGFVNDIRETLSIGFRAGFFSYRFDSESRLLKLNASFTASDGIFTGGGDQCLFIERDTFYELGCFDSQQVLMEDFEFFRRMKEQRVPYRIVKNDLLVSARKYRYNSYLRVNLSNLVLLILFRMGCPAEKLKSLHQRMLRLPYSGS